MRVLIEPKNSLIKQYKKLFRMENIKLEFHKEALVEFVKMAMERKSGARALRSVLEKAMLDLMFHLPEYSEDRVVCITITKDFVLRGKNPLMRRHRRSA
jgi:ATP-dependent Clp protease ATP-binding subunit ClpX